MSKVVVLVGSPRRNGNTALLVQAFEEGARLHNDVEIISVADYAVRPCCGCESCGKREDGLCCIQDDMQRIYPKLRDADVLVIASPIYFWNISAQLKCIIDRLHVPARKNFSIRKMGLILCGAGKELSVFDSARTMYQAVVDWFKFGTVGEVIVMDVPHAGDVKKQPDKLESAFRMGEAIS